MIQMFSWSCVHNAQVTLTQGRYVHVISRFKFHFLLCFVVLQSCESRRASKLKESLTVMQPNSDERDAHAGNGLSLNLQPEHLTKTQTPTGAPALPESGEVHVHMTGESGETSAGGASSRRSRASSHSHSHSHGHSRAHAHEPEPAESDMDSGESSSSFSELRYLYHWIQKSLPFLVILGSKLVIQHALGKIIAKKNQHRLSCAQQQEKVV